MNYIAEKTRGLSALLAVNFDRFLVPLLVVAALFLAGQLFGYATVP